MGDSFVYLQDLSYYDELYDRLTVDECRRIKWRDNSSEQAPDSNVEHQAHIQRRATEIMLYVAKGERYRRKVETIRQWINRARAKDQRMAQSNPPRNVRCHKCSAAMSCTYRDLSPVGSTEEEQVLFFFDCPRCSARRAYWENGVEREFRMSDCKTCSEKTNEKAMCDGEKLTINRSCPHCGEQEVEEVDLPAPSKPPDPNFSADRKKYCLDDKEGLDYIAQIERIRLLTETMEVREKNQDLYAALASVKRLTTAEVRQLLVPSIEANGYAMRNAEGVLIGRDIVFSFTVEDATPGRAKHESIRTLRNLINDALLNTNWSLMSDGIEHHLGVLTGRLRGVEGEEQLKELIARRMKKQSRFATESVE
jgi:hypothetical protein